MKMINAPAVADLLGLRVEQVYALTRQNILPAVRLGRKIRFDPDALKNWLADGGKPLPGGWRREPR